MQFRVCIHALAQNFFLVTFNPFIQGLYAIIKTHFVLDMALYIFGHVETVIIIKLYSIGGFI